MSLKLCPTFQTTGEKYHTSTAKCHRFIPEIPQHFDCRVKPHIRKECLNKELTIKDEQFKTTYTDDYFYKTQHLKEKHGRSVPSRAVDYCRSVEAKMFKNPPPPLRCPLSVMKSSYLPNYNLHCNQDELQAPVLAAKCFVVKKGFEQQPSVRVEGKGYWKYTDPYLTTNRMDFILHNVDDALLKNKTLTFYNANTFDLPAGSGNKTIFDRKVFNNVSPLRILWKPQDRVPNYGMTSEKQDNYKKHTFSAACPYLDHNCTFYEDSLAPPSAGQTQIAPGMYCTEYCHIGRHAPRVIVDPNYPKREIRRTPNCPQICTR